RDGATLVWVPPGQFRMGDNASPFQLDKPEHQVGLSTGVWLYKYPVTNTQYLRFLEANPEHPRPLFWDESKFNHPEQPVCGVSWHDAQEYCRWAGVRLPTEAEWEYAARGPEGRRYPWGDAAPTMDLAVYYQEGRTNRSGRVGRRPAGASWCGAEQMAGNVWEWCEDTYQPYVAGETVDPLPATGEGPRVVRGGAWNFPPLSTLSSNRHANGPNARANNIGFRPAVNPGVLDPSDS
ncbi:MAG: formylglycine-generating enzyme family protein, partial [SAR202 cluster bacterium]|nr:formylglycine-generating enzyme family protein [SAR202 cluster bacterium]